MCLCLQKLTKGSDRHLLLTYNGIAQSPQYDLFQTGAAAISVILNSLVSQGEMPSAGFHHAT